MNPIKLITIGFATLALVLTLTISDCKRAFRYGLGIIDFGPYIRTADRLRDKETLYVVNKDHMYTSEQFLYPPQMAAAIKLIPKMPVSKLIQGWTYANLFILTLCIALYLYTQRLSPLKDMYLVALITIVGFVNHPTIMELSFANVDLWILLAFISTLAITLKAKQTGNEKLNYWGSLLIACAASIKTWGLGLAAYMIMQKSYKAAVGAGLIFAAMLTVSFSILGLDEFEYFCQIQKLYAYQPLINSNSLYPIAKLLSGTNYAEYQEPMMLFAGADKILPAVAIALGVLIVSVLAVAGYRLNRCASTGDSAQYRMQSTLVWGLCLLTFILVYPVCHQYYYVFAIPTVWNLIIYADPQRRLGRMVEEDWKGLSMWFCAIAGYLLLFNNSPGLLPQVDAKNAQVTWLYASTLIGGLVLWSGTAIALFAPEARAESIYDFAPDNFDNKDAENINEIEKSRLS